METKINIRTIQQASKDWYIQAKRSGLLPIQLQNRHFKISTGYPDFTASEHAKWFISVLELIKHIKRNNNFSIKEIKENVYHCAYSNETVYGDFKIHIKNQLLSPEQQKLLYQELQTIQ